MALAYFKLAWPSLHSVGPFTINSTRQKQEVFWMKFYSSQNFVMSKNSLMGGVGAILADWDIFYFHRRMQCFSNSCRDIMRLVTVQYLIDSPQNDSKFFVVFRWPYPYLFLLSRGIQAMSRYVALTPTGSLQAGLASRQRINIFLIKKNSMRKMMIWIRKRSCLDHLLQYRRRVLSLEASGLSL